ncbi:hypothetical protein HAX54_017102, partial [Datura stramonium]|nr:hypothetical protein [Datura stramonium]
MEVRPWVLFPVEGGGVQRFVWTAFRWFSDEKRGRRRDGGLAGCWQGFGGSSGSCR